MADIPFIKFDLPDKEVRFKIELADTPTKRALGLMHRDHLPRDWGMLFVFDRPADHSFWMSNTAIALDLIFIRHDGYVLGTIEELVPFDTHSVSLGHPSSYALEINAGMCKKLGIEEGIHSSIHLPTNYSR